jgi:SAM-dependent methyltransferase
MNSTEVSAYAQAAASGQYARATGLEGKYDNVRVYWEEQSLRIMLRPHLRRLMSRRLEEGRNLRILDLGCGSGDGFETLMSLKREGAGWQEHAVELIPPDHLGQYTGVDLNPALLEQARHRYRREQNVVFVEADLREGLPFSAGEGPYDIYYASFGTLSHLSEEETIGLLVDVARHASDGAVLMVDWLGRYAYEWTELWNADTSREQWMDYRISYIYSEEERADRPIDSFPLRLLCPEEARRVFKQVEEETGIRLAERALFDRSLFVGRHMDTGDYNRHAPPLRAAVNRLHEPHCRTNLTDLLFDLHLPNGFQEPAEVLRRVHAAWNTVARFTGDALARVDEGASPPEIPAAAPDVARHAMVRLRATIGSLNAIEADDPRAEWIEPQLGLALRNIELTEDRGTGCGHGLVAVCEIRKT